MKKILATVVLAFMVSASGGFCQSEGHICFKKTPITGTEDQFFEDLAKKGFKKMAGYKAVTGQFAGTDVTVFTDTTLVSGTVWKVKANLNPRNNWQAVKSDYVLFKNYLTVKYGKPSNCYETFIGAYHEGDNMEMKAIANKKCSYVSNWNLPAGNISISIVPQKNSLACLMITYEDNQGLKLYANEQTEIFLEDL